jgi:hypothetical protein
MTDLPIMDLIASRQARDAGIAQITDHNATWMERGLRMIAIAPPMSGPFELWREHCWRAGLETPDKPNAWGALARSAVKRGLIRPTGRWVPMRDVRSHARRTPEYAS